jgi:multiple sugar transport system substrate-binding protein
MPSSVAPGKYNGKTYAVPWFANTEGLFYRTDLIKTPPMTPSQLVSDAKSAMKRDPSLMEGLAFEGAKYEGAVTSFMVFAGGTGGKLNPADLDTPQNLQALQFAHDAIYKYHVAPQAVTGWQEGQVQQEFTSGHTPFAIDWPFVFATAKGTPVQGKIGFVPFLGRGGTLGIENLAINAKSQHVQAAWKFIQYLTSAQVQDQRAIATGDPPAVSAAYNSGLFAKASYFKQVQQVAQVAAARPASPAYLQISADLQTMFSSVYSNLTQPAAALNTAAGQVKSLAGSG